MSEIRQVVEIPAEEFAYIKETNERILKALEGLQIVKPSEYLTAEEFMKAISCSRWKFNYLKDSGKLKTIKRGRKIYVPATEELRYFNGEMEEPR